LLKDGDIKDAENHGNACRVYDFTKLRQEKE
jgi:hypothetical protein